MSQTSTEDKIIRKVIEEARRDIKKRNFKAASVKLNEAVQIISLLSSKENQIVDVIEEALLDVKTDKLDQATIKLTQAMMSIVESQELPFGKPEEHEELPPVPLVSETQDVTQELPPMPLVSEAQEVTQKLPPMPLVSETKDARQEIPFIPQMKEERKKRISLGKSKINLVSFPILIKQNKKFLLRRAFIYSLIIGIIFVGLFVNRNDIYNTYIVRNDESVLHYREDGLLVMDYGYKEGKYVGPQIMPLNIGKAAERYYNNLQLGNETEYLYFNNTLKWFLENKITTEVENNSEILVLARWLYDFAIYNAPAGWYSAMADAQALRIFAYAFDLLENDTYFDICSQIINSFQIPIDLGGHSVILEDDSYWYPELIIPKEIDPNFAPNLVLNGFLYALEDLYAANQILNLTILDKIFQRGVESAIIHLNEYETSDNWTLYSLVSPPKYASQKYHNIHVQLVKSLHEITNITTFNDYYLRWSSFENPSEPDLLDSISLNWIIWGGISFLIAIVMIVTVDIGQVLMRRRKRTITTFIISKEYFIPLIIGFLTQIPRIPHTADIDQYFVINQAQMILKGHLSDWLIHPLSIFGLFPFSGYPIGTPSIMAIFLLLCNNSIDLAVFLYSLSILCLSLVSSTLFLKKLTNKKSLILVGNVLYILTPTLYEFSHFSAGARMMIFVLSPLLFYYVLKWQESQEKRDLAFAGFITLLSYLFHRMSLVLTVFFVTAVIVTILFEWWKNIGERNPDYALNAIKFVGKITVVSFIFLLFISRIVFEPDFKNVLTQVDFFKNWTPLLLDFVNLAFDYYIFFGPGIIFSLFGILLFFYHFLKTEDFNEMKKFSPYLTMVCFIVILTPFLFKTAYSRHLLLSILLPFTIYPMEYFLNKKVHFHISLSISYFTVFLFYLLFDSFWGNVGIYLNLIILISLIFIAISILFILSHRHQSLEQYGRFILKPRLKQHPETNSSELQDYLSVFLKRCVKSSHIIQISLLLLLVSVNSVILFDVKHVIDRDQDFPFQYTSDEEIRIANYIKRSQVYTTYPYITIAASHYLIETRIGAYAGTLILYDSHQISLIITDNINESMAIQHSSLISPIQWWSERTIFDFPFDGSDQEFWPTQVYWYRFMTNPFESTETQNIIANLNIKFFIKFKESNLCYFEEGYISTGDIFQSELAETFPEKYLALETEHLLLYELPIY